MLGGLFPDIFLLGWGQGAGSGREPLAPAGAESRCHQLVLRRVGGNGGDTGRGRQAMGLYVGWGMGDPTFSKMSEVTGRVKFQRYFKGI